MNAEPPAPAWNRAARRPATRARPDGATPDAGSMRPRSTAGDGKRSTPATAPTVAAQQRSPMGRSTHADRLYLVGGEYPAGALHVQQHDGVQLLPDQRQREQCVERKCPVLGHFRRAAVRCHPAKPGDEPRPRAARRAFRCAASRGAIASCRARRNTIVVENWLDDAEIKAALYRYLGPIFRGKWAPWRGPGGRRIRSPLLNGER
jgi:hypothetical protein